MTADQTPPSLKPRWITPPKPGAPICAHCGLPIMGVTLAHSRTLGYLHTFCSRRLRARQAQRNA